MTEIKDSYQRDNKGIPTIFVETEDGQYTFYCPYCEKQHYHGLTEGHRLAHCKLEGQNYDSPLNATGYYIRTKPNQRNIT